jgi:predicted house-cleaning noncanonical NTP pyrophosphatase (MazG superfamily)
MPLEYTKLVRDKIPEILDLKNISYQKQIADIYEYEIRLIEKLFEEVDEFKTDYSLEELADIIEVVEALKQLPKYKEVENIRLKKKLEKGGFEQRIVLTSIKSSIK